MKITTIITAILILTSFSVQSDGIVPFCKKKKTKEKEVIEVNIDGKGYSFEISFTSGKGHNNPSFAIWMESMNEEYIQELFVTESVATGIYRFGDSSTGEWRAGKKMYKATLPYFFHKRTTEAKALNEETAIIDAYTGATPQSDFILKTKSESKTNDKFRIILEINQAWDSNNYWNNAKYPNEKEYKNSLQPSLIYAVTIDPNNLMEEYTLNPIGHGHYAGHDGKLYTDISTFTTALEIASEIKIYVK